MATKREAEHDLDNVGPHYKRGRLYSTDGSIAEVIVPYGDAKKAGTRLEYLSKLDVSRKQQDMPRVRNTGIICTIGGPASNTVEVLRELIQKGLCVARINLSQVPKEDRVGNIKGTIAKVREAVSETPGQTVAIALDTQGREIRTGRLREGKEIKVETKERLRLSTDKKYENCGDKDCIYVDYEQILDTCSIGDLVYIDDGLIALKVTGKDSTSLFTEVQNGGKIGNRKGVNLPGNKVEKPVLTEQDEADLGIGVEEKVDMVFASFIQSAEDVREIRRVMRDMGDTGERILVISKIENEEGLHKFDEILKESDGIMVARGDLGIEIPPEKVFTSQKMMIGRCNRAGKPVIVATQMLESMTEKPRPTRAEVSDVANAVQDGADCVMLSGETAKGKYPVEAVDVMSKIALEAEAAMFHRSVFDEMCKLTPTPTNTVQTTAIAAVNASFQQHAAAIVTVTISGKTAFVLSQYRPQCPIIAVTGDSRTARICHLRCNVYPVLYKQYLSKDEWLKDMEEKLKAGVKEGLKRGFIKEKSTVVLLSGWVPGPDHINTIRIATAEEAIQ